MGYKEDLPPDLPPPRVRLAQGQEVSLGCGTLILIALIVMIFSGRSDNNLRSDLRRLQTEVSSMRDDVKQMADEVKSLREELAE